MLFWSGGEPSFAGEVDANAEVILGIGVDTNPLRTTDDGPNGGFAEARYDVALEQQIKTRLGWFLEADGEQRFHETSTEGGDFQFHTLRLGLEGVPVDGKRRLALSFGGLYRRDRRSFLDPATGEPYRVEADPPGDPPGDVAIPDRYNRNSLGPFFDLTWRANKRARLYIRSEYLLVNYVRDYDTTTTLEPLDYNELRVEPGVRLSYDPAVITLSLVLRERDYDDNMARDENGDPLPGTRRQYRYAEGRVRVLIVPAERWRFSFDVRGGERDDTVTGYYDYNNVAAYARAEWRPRPKLNLQLLGVYDDRHYANTLDPANSEDESRRSTLRRLTGRLGWDFRPKVGLFVETGLRQSHSRDPIYTYDEAWSFAGVRFVS